MTLSELIEHHNGEVFGTYQGHGWGVADVAFRTLADGQHFRYAINQKDAWPNVTVEVVQADGLLCSVYFTGTNQIN